MRKKSEESFNSVKFVSICLSHRQLPRWSQQWRQGRWTQSPRRASWQQQHSPWDQWWVESGLENAEPTRVLSSHGQEEEEPQGRGEGDRGPWLGGRHQTGPAYWHVTWERSGEAIIRRHWSNMQKKHPTFNTDVNTWFGGWRLRLVEIREDFLQHSLLCSSSVSCLLLLVWGPH